MMFEIHFIRSYQRAVSQQSCVDEKNLNYDYAIFLEIKIV